MLKRISFLRGTCPWILMDFRSPRRPLPGIQDFHNRKGLISDRGERQKSFYVMQRYYQEIEAARRKYRLCRVERNRLFRKIKQIADLSSRECLYEREVSPSPSLRLRR